jgi:hypothetical protein
MEAVRTSETSVNSYFTTQQYIPENSKLHSWICYVHFRPFGNKHTRLTLSQIYEHQYEKCEHNEIYNIKYIIHYTQISILQQLAADHPDPRRGYNLQVPSVHCWYSW